MRQNISPIDSDSCADFKSCVDLKSKKVNCNHHATKLLTDEDLDAVEDAIADSEDGAEDDRVYIDIISM